MSQNRSRRRGPHRAASQGMFRDFGEPGPSSGAGGAYGGPAQPPTSGQQVRGTRRWGIPGGQRLGRCGRLLHTLGLGPGTGVGTGSGAVAVAVAVAVAADAALPVLRGLEAHFPPASPGERARWAQQRSTDVPSVAHPSSSAVCYLSLRLCYLPTFLPSTLTFVLSAPEGRPLVRDWSHLGLDQRV